MKLIWHRRALREFNGAYEDLFDARPQAAIDWRVAAQRMIEMLENYPQIGALCRHDPDGEIRQIVVGRYRFVYRLNQKVLEMRRVRHVRRDYDPQIIRDAPRRDWRAFVVS
ncbi:MAG: type II toxin-antitoxin system RelE/ParE family toxin [Thermoanaerobaculia bacterium]